MSYYDLLLACVIGIVEGVTEFLPVSSTGHMILVGHLLKFEGAKAASFEIFIQLGAIGAVIVLYRTRFSALFDFSSKNKFSGLRGLVILGIACLPGLLFGAMSHGYIKRNLFSPRTVCAALIIGGIIMILIERKPLKTKVFKLEDISHRKSLAIGLFQSLALWPGVSRSASTIIGGMLTGLDRRTAAEFSFIVAVPMMLAATSWDLYKSFPLLSAADLPFFTVGFVAAFVSAMVSIKGFIRFLQRYTLTGFGIYRIILGVSYFMFIL